MRPLTGDEAGEARPAALYEVESFVLAEGAMAVGGRGNLDETGERIDVGLAHAALDLHVVHERTLVPGMRQPVFPSSHRYPADVATTPARRTSKKAIAERAVVISALLAESYPGTAKQLCALKHRGPFQLLVATILSAQCTDERVNLVTPALFRRYPGPRELAAADRDELESMIRSTGFFRSKTSHLIGMAQGLLAGFGPRPSDFPAEMAELTSLPGVGRKTANVVRSVALGLPGLPVDTHVLRLSRRLGLTKATDPVKVETDLCALFPETEWGGISLRLILHGRRVCLARRPRCGDCVLAEICPSADIGSAVAAPATPAGRRSAKKPPKLPIVVTPRPASR